MTDIVDKKTRARMMAGIKGKNTKPELALRQALHRSGFRFRLHCKNVVGRPDLVLAKHSAVIFVHGCFWHRHKGCRFATTPSTRTDFWKSKFEANVKRDKFVRQELLQNGWRVATVWECALRKPDQMQVSVERLTLWLASTENEIEI